MLSIAATISREAERAVLHTMVRPPIDEEVARLFATIRISVMARWVMSIPIQCRLRRWAAAIVVPHPQKGIEHEITLITG